MALTALVFGKRRFMKQDVFDKMVLLKLLVDNKNPDNQFLDETTALYSRVYPGEDAELLRTDVVSAARRAMKLVYGWPDTRGKSAEAQQMREGVLKDLWKMNDRLAPQRKGIFRGALFQFEKAPIKDRVDRCFANLSAAGLLLVEVVETELSAASARRK